jgi:hypothetical protein
MKRDYKNKITYWQNRLNEAINAAPCDYNQAKVAKALNSLTYFVNRQLEIESKEIYNNLLIKQL